MNRDVASEREGRIVASEREGRIDKTGGLIRSKKRNNK